MKTIQGKLVAKDQRVAIVSARFNDFIVHRLQEGALDGLQRHGLPREAIDIVEVPGAFEIPLIAQKLAHTQRYDAILCLGCVIRGATSHFEYVSAEVAKGIAQVSLQNDLPVIFGILTPNTLEQAIERAGTKAGNKGYDAALSAIEMMNLSYAIKNLGKV